MKRTLIAAALIAVCVFSAVAETLYITSQVNSFTDEIDRADSLVLKDDFEKAVGVCEDIRDRWNQSSTLIDALLIHDYVDGIGINLEQMLSHIKSGNPDMYFSHSAGAKKGLASIKESEFPIIENIL